MLRRTQWAHRPAGLSVLVPLEDITAGVRGKQNEQLLSSLVGVCPVARSTSRITGFRSWQAATHCAPKTFRINDDESGLHADIEKWLEKLAPEKPHDQYAHYRGEDNADAHLKRTIMGREMVVAVTGGRLDFGPRGTGLLRGIRRKTPEARPGQDHRNVSSSGGAASPAVGFLCPLAVAERGVKA